MCGRRESVADRCGPPRAAQISFRAVGEAVDVAHARKRARLTAAVYVAAGRLAKTQRYVVRLRSRVDGDTEGAIDGAARTAVAAAERAVHTAYALLPRARALVDGSALGDTSELRALTGSDVAAQLVRPRPLRPPPPPPWSA